MLAALGVEEAAGQGGGGDEEERRADDGEGRAHGETRAARAPGLHGGVGLLRGAESAGGQ